ncbi:MAG: hypothetical protein RBT41_12255 [Clostridia bacterium]|jgi:peptidoglycan hydrolase CwlO-like protein|nr:hypothetical protein [Clostridia bacterium]
MEETSRTTSRKRSRNNLAGALVIFVVWCGLVFGGFYIAKNYIDQTILKVQQTNALNIQAIENRLNDIQNGLQNLEDFVGVTGESISSRDSIQEEMMQKIAEFDRQIQELKNSLNILKEAPR